MYEYVFSQTHRLQIFHMGYVWSSLLSQNLMSVAYFALCLAFHFVLFALTQLHGCSIFHLCEYRQETTASQFQINTGEKLSCDSVDCDIFQSRSPVSFQVDSLARHVCVCVW